MGQSIERKTVLIADDDRGLVDMLCLRFEAAGFRTIKAEDGCRALSQALRRKPDAIVLDIHMPFGSGFNVQEHIYKLSMFDSVPVIYITGDDSAETRETARHFGAYALVHKPFDADELVTKVKHALVETIAA